MRFDDEAIGLNDPRKKMSVSLPAKNVRTTAESGWAAPKLMFQKYGPSGLTRDDFTPTLAPTRDIGAERKKRTAAALISLALSKIGGIEGGERIAGGLIGGMRGQQDFEFKNRVENWDRDNKRMKQIFDTDRATRTVDNQAEGQLGRLSVALRNSDSMDTQREATRGRWDADRQARSERDAARAELDQTRGELKKRDQDQREEAEKRRLKELSLKPQYQKLGALYKEVGDARTTPQRMVYVQQEIARIQNALGIGETTATGQPITGPVAVKGRTAAEKADDERQAREWAAKNNLDWSKFTEAKKENARKAAREKSLDGLKVEQFAETKRHNRVMETKGGKGGKVRDFDKEEQNLLRQLAETDNGISQTKRVIKGETDPSGRLARRRDLANRREVLVRQIKEVRRSAGRGPKAKPLEPAWQVNAAGAEFRMNNGKAEYRDPKTKKPLMAGKTSGGTNWRKL